MKTIVRLTTIFIMLLGLILLNPQQLSAVSLSVQKIAATTINGDPIITDTLSFSIMDPSNGIQFYKDNIITLSNSRFQQKMISDHISFGQIGTYIVNYEALDSYGNPMFITGNPFPVNPDGMTFPSDYSVLYYSAPEKGAKPGSPEKIYMVPVEEYQSTGQAYIDESEISRLPFCNDDDSFMHPAISIDNSYIIFSSDNSESIGGADLFMAKKEGDKWGEPVNLGSSINTNKNEIYPFLDNENNLYFSSEGHSGHGGFDIYHCRFMENGWGKPVNLTKSINSEDDDVAIKINQENKSGFFSVINRPGKNNKQLFRIHISGSGLLSDELYALAQGGDIKSDEVAAIAGLGLATQATLDEDKPEETAQETVEESAAELSNETSSGSAAGAAVVTTAAAAAVIAAADTEEEPEPVVEEPEPVVEEPEPVVEDDSETVYFRVQITSSTKPKVNYKVTIDGKSYPAFEYKYKGAYRYTVGNFLTTSEANAFKTKCRAAGFSQAFVAAFINDVRETDPAVFRK